ncbi:MAG TPA: tail fiber protein [Chitinophagaceae bacterium]
MKQFVFFLLLVTGLCAQAQNVGIGTSTPTEKLEVNGKLKSTGAIITNGGQQYDFLVKSNAAGEVGFKKATGAVGINYIICLQGNWPNSGSPIAQPPFLGEVKLFAGNYAPAGWAFCHGQILPIAQNTALFALLGVYYGGNGQTTFALPDLRGATVVSPGTSPAGYNWQIGEKTN